LIYHAEIIQGVVKQLKKSLGAMAGGGPSQTSWPAQASSQPPPQTHPISQADPNAGIFAGITSGTVGIATTEPAGDDPFSNIGADVKKESNISEEAAKSPDEDMFKFDV